MQIRSGNSRGRRQSSSRAIALAEALESRRLLATIFVDTRGPANGNGTTWANAYRSLQTALASALPQDTIKIGAGTYKPTASTDRSATFSLPNSVLIFGGYAGTGTTNPDQRDAKTFVTTLSGDIGAQGVKTDNVYHVLTSSNNTNTTILDGVTITGGFADGTGGVNSAFGAGIFMVSSQAILSNLVVTQNSTLGTTNVTDAGAGLYALNSRPFVLNTTFSTNSTSGTGTGGGVYISGTGGPQFTGSFLNANSAGTGGGVYITGGATPTFSTTDFNNNTATIAGGAIASVSSGTVTYTRARLQSNIVTTSATDSPARGGGIFLDASTATFTGGGIFENQALGTNAAGGGIYSSNNSSLTVNTTIVFGNSTAGDGGALFSDGTSRFSSTSSTYYSNRTTARNGGAIFYAGKSLSLVNATITGNAAFSGSGGALRLAPAATATITNSILYNNGAAAASEISLADNTATANVTFSDVQGGFAGTGNLDVNPGFITATNPNTFAPGDFHLSANSPVIDRGSNAALPAGSTFDLDGKNRIQGQIVDLGAYETTPPPDLTPPPSPPAPPPPVQTTAAFTVSWSGTDPAPGSGVASYTIFVSDNGEPYTVFLADTTQTSAQFTGLGNHTYSFYSIAKDGAPTPNTEVKTPTAEATTTIDLPDITRPTSSVTALAPFTGSLAIPLAWSGTDDSGAVASYSVFVSENGGPFTAFLSDTTATTGSFTGSPGNTYGFYTLAKDATGNTEVKTVAEATTIIDTTPPTSTVAVLPSLSPAVFTLNWSGTDTGGAGISSYSIFVSDDGGPFTAFLTNTSQSAANFTAQENHTYAFYSVATDLVGNVEPTPTTPQATTTVDGFAPTSTIAALPAISDTTLIPLSWSGSDNRTGIRSYDIFVSTNNGPYTTFLANTVLTSTPFQGTPGGSYRFYSIATDNAGNVQPTPATPQATTLIDNALLFDQSNPAAPIDLSIRSITTKLPKLVNGAIIGGTPFSGVVTLTNLGTSLATGTVTVNLYLSNDTTVSGADAFLGQVRSKPLKLKPNAAATVAYSFPTPLNLSGSQRVLAWLNPANTLSESNTLNNSAAALAPIVTAPQSLNLAAVSIRAKTPRPNRAATATLVVRNDSNVVFNRTVPITLTFTNTTTNAVTTLPTKTGTIRLKLNPGQSTTISIPYSTLQALAGLSGRISVRLDPNTTLGETQTTDNTAELPLTIAPN